jgi:regulatory protein
LARRALAQELRRRGVADELAAEAVAALGAEEELATARDLVARRLAATRCLPIEQRARRLAGLLARKGYHADIAWRVVRDALALDAEDGQAGCGVGDDDQVVARRGLARQRRPDRS